MLNTIFLYVYLCYRLFASVNYNKSPNSVTVCYVLYFTVIFVTLCTITLPYLRKRVIHKQIMNHIFAAAMFHILLTVAWTALGISLLAGQYQ